MKSFVSKEAFHSLSSNLRPVIVIVIGAENVIRKLQLRLVK